MSDLFADSARDKSAAAQPLAEKLRPGTLTEVVGQALLNQARHLFIKRKSGAGRRWLGPYRLIVIFYNPKRARPSSVFIEKSTPCKSSASDVHKYATALAAVWSGN